MLSTVLAGKAVAAAAAGGLAIAGTAAAAYTGSLPDSLQDLAHATIGAPAAKHATTPTTPETPAPSATGRPATATPVGPDASGSAAFGLCTAWGKGGLATKSVAYDSLVKAAGGADKIKAYCATVAHPGKAESHPTGEPTSHPTGAPETHPTGEPTHPTGEPTKPTGR